MPDIKAYDDQEMPPTTKEIKIVTLFQKAKGQPVNINLEILNNQMNLVHPKTIGFMIAAAMVHWCNQVTPKQGDIALLPEECEIAASIRADAENILKKLQMVDTNNTLKKLFE